MERAVYSRQVDKSIDNSIQNSLFFMHIGGLQLSRNDGKNKNRVQI